jgi:hypothetical protein
MQKRKIGSALAFLTVSKVKSVNRQTGALILCLLIAHCFTITVSNRQAAIKSVIPVMAVNNCDEVCWYEVRNISNPEASDILWSETLFNNHPINEDSQSHYLTPSTNGLQQNSCLILRL